MKRRHWLVASGLLGLALGGTELCRADTVFLKDGSEVEGTVTEEDNNTVVIKQTNGTIRSFRKTDVDTVLKSPRVNVQATPAPAPAPAAPAAPAVPSQPGVATTPNGQPAVPGTPGATAPVVPGTTPAAPGTPGAPAVGAVPAPGAPATPGAPGTDVKNADPNKPPEDPEAAKAEKEWKEWTPPPGLASFPDHAKRMEKAKEAQFMQALDALANAGAGNTDAINKAKGDISALGNDALPYVVAGTQHANVDARSACMSLIPGMDGKRATKQVIEVFYAAMPADGRCAWYQVQFIDKIRDTLTAITGQNFINVQSKDALVQNGLKQYIDWYNQVLLTLPPQLGEKKVSQTDPKYVQKITEMRQLKLNKRDWPAPAQPSDLQDPNGLQGVKAQTPLNEATTQRDSDRNFAKDGFQKVDRNDALKRPQDKQNEQ